MHERDDIDLLYVLRPHGWSDVLLYVGGDVHHFCTTHIFSDPTADLVQLAVSLSDRASEFKLFLWDEPGGHSLQFEQIPDQHHNYVARLCCFPESPPEPSSLTETTLVEFKVKADHFVKLIYGELEKMVRLLEEKSYREHRDFPYTDFKRLRAHVVG